MPWIYFSALPIHLSMLFYLFSAWRWGWAIYFRGHMSFEHREHWCPLVWDLFSGQLWQWRPNTLKEERALPLCRCSYPVVVLVCLLKKYFLLSYHSVYVPLRRRKAVETNATVHGSVLRRNVLKGISAQIVSAAVRGKILYSLLHNAVLHKLCWNMLCIWWLHI